MRDVEERRRVARAGHDRGRQDREEAVVTCEVCEDAEAVERIEDHEDGDVLHVCETCARAVEVHVDEELWRRDLDRHGETLYPRSEEGDG